MIRFALYGQVNTFSSLYVLASLALFLGLAIYGYDPGRGLIARRGEPVG
jgi:ABC-2 type transport system permease protein